MWEIEKHLQKGEKVIYEGTPNRMGYLGAYIIAFLLLFTVIVPILLILYVILEQRSYKFIITNKRVATRKGILSEEFQSSTFKHITSVHVRQSIFGKIFGYGAITVDTAGTGEDIELYWKYVTDPISVKNKIEKHVHK